MDEPGRQQRDSTAYIVYIVIESSHRSGYCIPTKRSRSVGFEQGTHSIQQNKRKEESKKKKKKRGEEKSKIGNSIDQELNLKISIFNSELNAFLFGGKENNMWFVWSVVDLSFVHPGFRKDDAFNLGVWRCAVRFTKGGRTTRFRGLNDNLRPSRESKNGRELGTNRVTCSRTSRDPLQKCYSAVYREEMKKNVDLDRTS
ncbi:uncharacterized protein MCYG_04840 [Microsporum canis CBS 113480]|uniref:Uncharacterized protein n=1 Tax=Arthroderma otae (strain ATCC MYA-4605 / CBS 113480) TaxID=554155 RepID=C5FQ68_ARTOC|nr:uncharacterized protein MCYG_04840 [Microsporum canis CBS 113480]EEQ32021.1 predicted protein [Microsporum canis CBS 113480]